MGIIRRESSDVSVDTAHLKEKQLSMEVIDVSGNSPDEAHQQASRPTTSPQLSRPSLLPPLQHSPSMAAREGLLSLSLDSSLQAQQEDEPSSPLTGSEGASTKRTLSVDEMRSVLLDHKQRVISRLESLGYDPYKGVYVRHRTWLMDEKTKVVNRLEELGFDPLTGSKKQRV